MSAALLDAKQVAAFQKDGFLIVDSLFSQEEVTLLGQPMGKGARSN